MMGAPKGNKFWEARASHGRDKIFATPQDLWNAAVEYFEWVESHPLEEQVVYQGEVMEKPKSLMRAMTMKGLSLFLDCDIETLNNYATKADYKDFFGVSERIRKVIDTQKFEGASAGLLNPVIIARDLGLKDVAVNEHTGKGGGPIETATLTADDYKKARQEMIDKDDC
jgi:hypothetical protein